MNIPLISAPDDLFGESEPKYIFAKPELPPDDPKYYEVQAVQVTAECLAQQPDFKVVTKERPEGEPVKETDWIITRMDTTDGTTQQWPIRHATFSERWKPVADKPGFFTPRSVPTSMVELPAGGRVMTSRGEAVGSPGSFLIQNGPGRYNIISAKDLVSTYVGMDDVSRAKLAEMIAKGI